MNMLWIDFLNSNYHDWRGGSRSEDRLEKPAWLSDFIHKWRLTAELVPQTADMNALKELRDFLFRMAQDITSVGQVRDEDLDILNEYLRMSAVIRQIEKTESAYNLLVSPVDRNWRAVMSEIAAAFAQTVSAGESSRIRICDNPDCLWVFYDDTRNRSKRFCDDKLCGNLMKVRRFRARKKDNTNRIKNE